MTDIVAAGFLTLRQEVLAQQAFSRLLGAERIALSLRGELADV